MKFITIKIWQTPENQASKRNHRSTDQPYRSTIHRREICNKKKKKPITRTQKKRKSNQTDIRHLEQKMGGSEGEGGVIWSQWNERSRKGLWFRMEENSISLHSDTLIPQASENPKPPLPFPPSAWINPYMLSPYIVLSRPYPFFNPLD